MHTRTTLKKVLYSAVCIVPFTTAQNASVSEVQLSPVYDWIKTAGGNGATSNETHGPLGERHDRGYQCLNPRASVDDGARASECLNQLLRWPYYAEMTDFRAREGEEGHVPTTLTQGRCIITLDFLDPTTRQERSSWLYMHHQALALINLCKRGPEHRVQGQVVFGEQGLLKLTIQKARAPPRGVGEEMGQGTGNSTTDIPTDSDPEDTPAPTSVSNFKY